MRLVNFLQAVQNNAPMLREYSVFGFKGSELQSFFFTTLLAYLVDKKIFSNNYQYYPLARTSKDVDVFESLGQSVLGMSTMYWLGDVSSRTLPKDLKKKLPAFLTYYKGPHRIFFFSDIIMPSANMLVVDCEVEISLELIDLIMELNGIALSKQKIRIIFLQAKELFPFSLDSLSMLIHYFNLIPVRTIDVDALYVERLLSSQASLSSLVEAFLERNSEKFYALWNNLKHKYSEIFWIAFWADVCWRAHHIHYFMSLSLYRQAKQMSYRFPFIFINHLWKKVQKDEFVIMYQRLYECDYRLKKGIVKESVEPLFYTYFS